MSHRFPPSHAPNHNHSEQFSNLIRATGESCGIKTASFKE